MNSLGCVLLELGFWQKLDTFKEEADRGLTGKIPDSEDPHHFRKRLVELAGGELRGQMGRIYAEATKECLGIGSKTNDKEAQRLLCWKVASALDRCTA